MTSKNRERCGKIFWGAITVASVIATGLFTFRLVRILEEGEVGLKEFIEENEEEDLRAAFI